MRTRSPSWFLTAPLLAIGLLAGHALGYRFALPDAHERAHVLEESGHAYSAVLPLAIAVALTLVLASLACRVRRVIRGEQLGHAPPWLLALLPPVAFLVQEFAERWLNGGHIHLATLWEPAVLLGLHLQIPFALLALWLARGLARAADALGRALACEPWAARLELGGSGPSVGNSLAAARIAGRGWTERGPPSVFAES